MALAQRPIVEEDKSLISLLLPRRPPSNRNGQAKEINATKGTRIWTLQNGHPQAMEVKTGATDGIQTEILEGSLTAGTQVLVDIEKTGTKP